MKTLYDISVKGRRCTELPKTGIPAYRLEEKLRRLSGPKLPEAAEVQVVRHYTALARQTYGVDDGFYPLGSCTMKYNPKIAEETAALPGFTDIHPLQDPRSVQGALRVYRELEDSLREVTGMDALSFQAAAGAHGEFSGMLIIKKYFLDRREPRRTKIIVPDSAHGTNPASAHMCGFEVISVPSKDGYVDLEELKRLADDTVAGLMLTNPNTLGLYDPGILEITKIIHDCGGLVYYDGANLNAIMGISRPGDMGFDICHLNLHKTFATPHGGGGPGAGVTGVKGFLKPYLMNPAIREEKGLLTYEYSKDSVGKIRSFYGNFLVLVRALNYIIMLGSDGLKEASEAAVLNANYLMRLLKPEYAPAYDRTCMHEFVLDLSKLKEAKGITAMDIAKGLIDYGIHPPTMYFPLIVHEALMFEPTETEGPETLKECAKAMKELAAADPDKLHTAPNTTFYSRLDEVAAARHPILVQDLKDAG